MASSLAPACLLYRTTVRQFLTARGHATGTKPYLILTTCKKKKREEARNGSIATRGVDGKNCNPKHFYEPKGSLENRTPSALKDDMRSWRQSMYLVLNSLRQYYSSCCGRSLPLGLKAGAQRGSKAPSPNTKPPAVRDKHSH